LNPTQIANQLGYFSREQVLVLFLLLFVAFVIVLIAAAGIFSIAGEWEKKQLKKEIRKEMERELEKGRRMRY